MNYTKFDVKNWVRREHFEFYRHRLPCGFSLTSKIDITTLKKSLDDSAYKFYPVMIYLTAQAVNQFDELRMAIKDDELIVWDSVDPQFTVFHQETETFSALSCPYSSDIDQFMVNYLSVMERYKSDTKLFPQGVTPENHLNISALPWVNFDSFNLNVANFTDYFAPIITMAKYQQEGDKLLLPLSVQVHHAVCDGFHVARFINRLQELCNSKLK
ncbi:type A chloramphenicol O-acetyltransferase [Providencia stuartii]|uniref:type A chloramphenicol O-acetyltransferase n=1 Tax=Providencia stuartii TaxID=588 RepID=UPI0028C1D888|nr:type A chloramphenicol O-acetyltransferase [Providencia stuartii]MDT7050105.1 type A chloramphenicol O-acetyltransferase [Providencia stuartii]